MGEETYIQVDIGTFLTFVWGAISILILGPVAWIVKGLLEAQKKIKEDHSAFRDEVHREFVRKSDYIDQLSEIKDLIRRIYDKLDGKADKKL